MEFEASSVLLYLAVFLIAAKAGGALSSKLGQPEVFGELIAGILIGPSVAGAITQGLLGFSLCVDPDAPAGQFMALLGELGIIILMFIAGLSIEVEEFRRSGRPSTIVAASGVAVAFLLGFGAASFFGWTPLEAGFAGGILVATSVGITVRTLMEIRVLHTKVGLTILGAAVIDDVLGIIILSVLSGMAFGSLSFFGIAEILFLMVVFFVVVLVFGFRVVPRLLSYASRFAADEIVLSIAFAIVFLVSAMAEKVRIAAITGAFLVGLITSKSQFADSLREKATTVGYGLLIPLFFVNMGVETNLQALASVGFLAVAFLAIAMFDKIVGCGLGALLSGFSVKDSLRVGVGMMPRAEVALIMASIGLKAAVVGQSLLSMTVMVVLLTSLVTPLLVKLAFKGAEKEA
ncbi:MAG: cation:proton antiporter [Candidatus Hadarchaeum sp.]|uniref:cation:proton antiporter n=1 Tax=Candidatus Hadarchaeum sp. TaxID=2883567 RepID=UPI003174B436